MPGFDDRWRDAPDYVLGITRDIWEDRRIDSLLGYYGPDLVVRSPASVVVGNAGIIAATEATLAEFPDRELLGEDVIWCPTGDDSFLSSHRLICTATHSGPGMYGAPTGRRLRYRILADCWCRANAVQDEWLVRDQGAIVRQMGQDLVEWTRDLIAREGGPEACVKPLTPATDVAGPYDGRGNDSEYGQALADLLQRIMSGAFSAIAAGYDRAAELAYPGHVTGAGHADADRFWLSLRSAFPSALFAVDHVIGMTDPLSPPRAAVRWSLTGRHDGWGAFGAPTGAEVYVMGITHAEFGPRGLRREWTLIDETAIWKQILLATGAA
ncbi:ester cyclase [Aestuariicoccus sp. MJ-SS9]|uniref:nuclear transport factor 2 family protein n=1 Tax=Aestuariicoccus sp. MJ-SS9 TaxID=3079855 RepID=UPI0029082C32|nr:ester cyclase [Aestuariicoccus sp. MJ-SS9]MDU8910829.1 ester cyclase [Aestuariicoccus sp. MJ-SS9]